MLSQVLKILEVARPVAKTLPVLGNILEGSIETAIQLAKFAEARIFVCFLDIMTH